MGLMPDVSCPRSASLPPVTGSATSSAREAGSCMSGGRARAAVSPRRPGCSALESVAGWPLGGECLGSRVNTGCQTCAMHTHTMPCS